ncbi:MAG: PrgI family protein [Defluviitaleaceae bacterium]|nr:PrgI family protein [Defluviitaleaceae bacterium]
MSIPKDLNLIKSRIALNMSPRQLVCFGTAVTIGLPTYLFTRGTIGDTGAVLVMMGVMMPLFMLAMYERDSQPAEIVMRNYIRAKLFWPGIRTYKTENLFEKLDKEGDSFAYQPKNKAAARPRKTPIVKRDAGTGKHGRRKKVGERR